MDIVRGLAANEKTMYELEIKPDGTLRVGPCERMIRDDAERKLLKNAISADEVDSPEEPLPN